MSRYNPSRPLRAKLFFDKTITPKEVNHGKNGESKGLGHDIENEKNESERKSSEEKEHEIIRSRLRKHLMR